jgi:hypothetical protein
MRSRLITLILGIALVFSVLALAPKLLGWRQPGDNQGYEPVQPIAFSHRLHAGELGISCAYCHQGVEKSKHAGIPSGELCLNCHRSVRAPLAVQQAEDDLARAEKREPKKLVSPELRKLYDALALDENLKPIAGKKATPIAWVQVHKLPAFACFSHQAHVTAGVDCKVCHGPVETMEKVQQVGNLSMGWCVNCHRDMDGKVNSGKTVHPSTDCAVCHY